MGISSCSIRFYRTTPPYRLFPIAMFDDTGGYIMGVCIYVREYGSMFLRGTGVSLGINMGLPTGDIIGIYSGINTYRMGISSGKIIYNLRIFATPRVYTPNPPIRNSHRSRGSATFFWGKPGLQLLGFRVARCLRFSTFYLIFNP